MSLLGFRHFAHQNGLIIQLFRFRVSSFALHCDMQNVRSTPHARRLSRSVAWGAAPGNRGFQMAQQVAVLDVTGPYQREMWQTPSEWPGY
ncbi:hypothetical protein PMIN01_07496 [Paraphaeosphaeria minitans]|uniref:Uncharacterized protein n=1 Tax=Paraphaeosphaeria minitans TaxID=565426 RepID=A0A9P6GGD8_9PLEO|nr:hypothetical protein PMIN01_07496 [Paraphaeosphaeria minitans]